VSWSVVGELSDDATDGLAMFSFDLAFDGGDLDPADTPVAGDVLQFVAPAGLNNPDGFGGTPIAGALVQVGGALNTINNAFAPTPNGFVVTGFAQQGSPEVLATGTLTAPLQVGTYVLSISNVMANGLRDGATGTPFWTVDAVGQGTVTHLVIEVVALFGDAETLSIGSPPVLSFSLDAGPPRAGRAYWLLGTIAGSDPGLGLPNGTVVPLNPSVYLDFSIASPNTFPLGNSMGVLDGLGQAGASFTLPGGLPAAAAGLVVTHAFVLLSPVDFASNAQEVTLVP
jgi:hypothetical protein